MLIGLPVTYFLIAPREKLGLNIGANGLAIKMVALQFLAVNVQLFFNARFLSLKLNNYLIHQILSVLMMLSLSLAADYFSQNFLSLAENIIINFIVSGILYTVFVGVITFFLPVLFGLQREDIIKLTQLLKVSSQSDIK